MIFSDIQGLRDWVTPNNKEINYRILDFETLLSEYSTDDKVLAYLKSVLRIPDFLLDPDTIKSLKGIIRDEYLRVSPSDSVVIQFSEDDSILDVLSTDIPPVSHISQCSRVLDALRDTHSLYYEESIVSPTSIQLLLTSPTSVITDTLSGGIVLRFDSSSPTVSARRYLKEDGLCVYLPVKHYSKSTGRYLRYTGDHRLALDMMLQNILSDVESQYYRDSLEASVESLRDPSAPLSLEEVSTIVASTQDKDAMTLLEYYEEDPMFESHYIDYLWRCSNIGVSISEVISVLRELSVESTASDACRTILGSILTNPLMVDRLCVKDQSSVSHT